MQIEISCSSSELHSFLLAVNWYTVSLLRHSSSNLLGGAAHALRSRKLTSQCFWLSAGGRGCMSLCHYPINKQQFVTRRCHPLIVFLANKQPQKATERYCMLTGRKERNRKYVWDCPLAPAQSSALTSKNGRCRSRNKQAGRRSDDGALYPTRERSSWKHGEGC